MVRRFAVSALLLSAAPAMAASPTNFGERSIDGAQVVTPIVTEGQPDSGTYRPLTGAPRSNVSLSAAASIGARWGRVTSTYRSPAHNRRVGGVPNSHHLRGRAIDIARRPGVRHADIAAAYRAAGYHLVESLDEGDHSHFAFGFGSRSVAAAPSRAPATTSKDDGTRWAIVYAPRASR